MSNTFIFLFLTVQVSNTIIIFFCKSLLQNDLKEEPWATQSLKGESKKEIQKTSETTKQEMEEDLEYQLYHREEDRLPDDGDFDDEVWERSFLEYEKDAESFKEQNFPS